MATVLWTGEGAMAWLRVVTGEGGLWVAMYSTVTGEGAMAWLSTVCVDWRGGYVGWLSTVL